MCHPWPRASPGERAWGTNCCFGELNYLFGCKKRMLNYVHHQITFYTIFMDVRTHVMEPHQHYPWIIGSMQSAIAYDIPMLCISFLVTSHSFLYIRILHSGGITFLAAFTSAPFCSKTSTTFLHLFCADTYKGVAPSWGIQHAQQTQMRKKKMVRRQMLHNIHSLQFFQTVKQTKTHLW